MCEIGASSWFYYKEICYDARSHERKKKSVSIFRIVYEEWRQQGRQKYRSTW